MRHSRKDLPESVRLTESDYRQMVEKAKNAVTYAKKMAEEGHVAFDADLFPTEEDLISHDVKYDLRRYLPMLVIYYEPGLFESDDEDYPEAKNYIDEIIDEYVVIMDDEDCREIREMTPEKWREMDLQARCDVLDPMVSYYAWNEFDSFMKDLGYLPFMRYAGYSKKKHSSGIKSERLESDMMDIWEELHRRWKEQMRKSRGKSTEENI